ncbi:TonB-linked outer membrane protein, SusC/RagA family [Chitinophaga sp. CF418]|nr:TonB-linked outer membrane protein, SusC/RagA family [Chitinophaga sp. CF418]
MQIKGHFNPGVPPMSKGIRSTKNLPVMKSAIMLFFMALVLAAGGASAQTVTFTARSTPLKKIFAVIRQQTSYKFFYRNEDLELASPITVQLKDIPLERALQIIMANQPLTFNIQGKTIFVSRRIPSSVAVPADVEATPPSNISGRVTDNEGQLLSNITVMLRNGRRYVFTNEKGEFTIYGLMQNDTLLFTSINYESVLVPFSRMSENMTIIMRPRINALNTVVIYNTGYQQISRERATGAFGKPDMEIFRERVSTFDVVGRLEGQIPGLTVGTGVTASGRTGNGFASRSSVIRGYTTVSGGQPTNPLYVVNGVITTDFSSVNPDDIEDITVLKDAAAAAIWGARAANGIIVVKTKEGSRNQQLKVNYTGSLSFQSKPDLNFNQRMNSEQYIQAAKETFDPVNYPWSSLATQVVLPHEIVLYNQYRGLITADQANRSLDSMSRISNLSQIRDLFYRNPLTTNHTISLSAGNSVYAMYASLGWTGVQSSTPGDKNNTYKINLSQSFNIGKRINVSLNTSLINNVNSRKNMPSVDNSFAPYQLFVDQQGREQNMAFTNGWSDSTRNNYSARSRLNLDYYPLQEINYAHSSGNTLSINTTANIGIKLWKGISFQGTYGYLKAPGTTTSFTDSRALSQRKQLLSFTVAPSPSSTPVYYLPVNNSMYISTNNDQRNWTVRNQLVYNATPRSGKDMLTLQAGQEAQEAQSSRNTNTIIGYDEALGTYPLIDYATLRRGVFGTVTGFGFFSTQPYQIFKELTRFTSWFALASYTLNHKYSLDLSWRRDHSNQFGSDVSVQNKPVWSVGGKWLVRNENFMQQVNWVDALALRATYGITGNSPYVGSASLYDILYAQPQLQTGGVAGDALTISQPANRKLAWERTQTTNIGIDFSVLKNRISGAIDVYSKTTTDLLGRVPLNPFTGYDSQTGNVGKLVNRGIELSLRTINIRKQDWSWSSNLVFSYNYNKLVSYAALNPSLNTASYKLSAPYWIGYNSKPLFAYQFAGLDNVGDPQIRLSDKSVTKQPYIAQPEDVAYAGTTQSPVNGGFTNRFEYKGISLTMNMIYNMGAVMRRNVNIFYTGRMPTSTSLGGDNLIASFQHRWKQPGDEKLTNIPSYVSNMGTSYTRRDVNYYINGDVNVLSASYIKIRDITLAYELQSTALHFLKIQRLNIYAQTTNFLIWTANDERIDPETGFPGALYKHQYNLGVNVTL